MQIKPLLTVSALALALGTAANAACGAILARRGQWVALAVVLAWQYGLLMQLPDALAWRAIARVGAMAR